MEIIGLGTDIEKVSRFAGRSESFLRKCFTEREIEYCMRHRNFAQHLAGRFCAKEAFSKAMGHPNEWHDAEIINNDRGKPQIILAGKAKEELENCETEVSISHCDDYATATVIIYKK